MLVTREKYAIRSDQIGIEVSLQTRRRHEREKWPKNSLAVPSLLPPRRDTYRNRSLTKHHTFLGQLSITIVVTWFMLVSRDTRFRERGATKLRIKIPRLHADNKKYVCIQRVNAHNIVFHRERTRIYIWRWNGKEWKGSNRICVIANCGRRTFGDVLSSFSSCVRVFKSARFCTHCQKVKTSSTLVARHRHLSARSTVIYACAFRFRGCILCQVVCVDV